MYFCHKSLSFIPSGHPWSVWYKQIWKSADWILKEGVQHCIQGGGQSQEDLRNHQDISSSPHACKYDFYWLPNCVGVDENYHDNSFFLRPGIHWHWRWHRDVTTSCTFIFIKHYFKSNGIVLISFFSGLCLAIGYHKSSFLGSQHNKSNVQSLKKYWFIEFVNVLLHVQSNMFSVGCNWWQKIRKSDIFSLTFINMYG